MKVCSVNSNGEFIFLQEGALPENVPKVKHPPREMHPDYNNFLRQEIIDRVNKKKRQALENKLNLRSTKVMWAYNINKMFNLLCQK